MIALSKDHKPNDPDEKERIELGGGKIYQTKSVVPKMNGSGTDVILGPFRIFPGRLSVARSFGDVMAKDE